MRQRSNIILVCAVLLAVLFAGCGGLAGEPRIVASLPPATAAPTQAIFPATAPDVVLGAQVFAANCTRCHGTDGKGNGELVQSGQVAKPADFTDAATTAEQSPADFYAIITDGKLESLMPPWGDSLSDAERWSATMYTYTLPLTRAQIGHGRELYDANCAGCDLDDPAQIVSLSGDALNTRIGDIPVLAALSEDDHRDVAAYLRSVAVANPDAIGANVQAESTEEAIAEAAATEIALPASVTISGSVTNGSAGGSVPADLGVTLFSFDADFNQQQITSNTNADGTFSFPDVPLDAAGTYAVTVDYRNIVFASDLLSGDALSADAADGTLSLPISIYELTEDPDVIRITGLVTQISAAEDNLQVAQVFNVTNTGDRAFTSSQIAPNGGTISLVITLPPGAVVAGFPDNQNRYSVDQDNFTIFDTLPVLPGEEHLVQVIYLVPYDSGGAIIEQPLNYALDGPVRLLVSPLTVGVSSEQLRSRGTETVGSSQFQGYGANLALAAGDVLRYELSGAGPDPSAPITVSSNNLIPIVAGALIIAALLGGGLIIIGTRSRSGDQRVIDILVRQVAELDAEHDAGRLDDEAYERQRAALKARLTTLMERKK